jgi:FKBP-type peptidyl-prolyl cis-trans isomerase
MIERWIALVSLLLVLPACERAPAPSDKEAPGSEKAADTSKDGQKPAAVNPTALVPAGAKAGSAVKLPSGLEYTLLKEGEGSSPPLGSKVITHYTIWLPGGKVFEDTRAASTPRELKLDNINLISGLVETLASMKKGEKRRVHVPSHLAYGNLGYGAAIRPNTDLDIEIELLSFTSPETASPPPVNPPAAVK